MPTDTEFVEKKLKKFHFYWSILLAKVVINNKLVHGTN